MKVGIYGDVHLTRNMRSLQHIWDVTAMTSIVSMYDKFDELGVQCAVCLGDFFDAPRIEAKSMSLVLPILESINKRHYPTYLLLGNHEAVDSETNIIDFISSYEKIIPVTTTTEVWDMLFLPYYEDPANVSIEPRHIVFTHHDIYGSELASGKTKAFFGLNPDVFKDAKLVVNGHVHLKSKVSHNIINAGSLLVSQQGELKVGDYPSYYLLDYATGELTSYDNKYSMIFQSVDEKDVSEVYKYDQAHLVLRVDYEGELPENFINTAHTSWRKKINSIEGKDEEVVNTSNFDLKNYLVKYLESDEDINEKDKKEYIATGLELIGS